MCICQSTLVECHHQGFKDDLLVKVSMYICANKIRQGQRYPEEEEDAGQEGRRKKLAKDFPFLGLAFANILASQTGAA